MTWDAAGNMYACRTKKHSCSLYFCSRVARWFIFKPKIPIWVYFGGTRNVKCCYILWPFGMFCGHLVQFKAGSLWSFCIFFPFWYVCTMKIWQPCFAVVQVGTVDTRFPSEPLDRAFPAQTKNHFCKQAIHLRSRRKIHSRIEEERVQRAM
jgi:hypothetical protein